MCVVKRSSHPSVAERDAIEADRIINYEDERYTIARDGSLRNSKGQFVRGTRTTGGFDFHPENRRKGGGWDKRMTISYQYRRYLNMEKMDFIALGKRYRLIPLEKGEHPSDYPYEDHTIVEANAFVMVLMALDSLECVKEIANRVEGRPIQACACQTSTGWKN